LKAVLFDMDDTLYPESDFVKSGFRAVSCYLRSKYGLAEDWLLDEMLRILQRDGRGKVFDTLLENLGLYSDDHIKLLVYIYRSHRPTIYPFRDVLPIVDNLKKDGLRLGIVTDGMGSVQRNKIAALGMESLFDVIVCTDELGREYWKPSVVAFKIALELLQVSATQAAYVGDNVHKDFVGPNSIGMLTIQVRKQDVQNVRAEGLYDPLLSARFIVDELKEIRTLIRGRRGGF